MRQLSWTHFLVLLPLKTRQQAMWAYGNFAVIGSTLQPVGESLCEAAQLEAGERVLDVACGNATKRHFTFRYLSAEHFIDVLQRTYGPTHKAFGSLDADGQRAMTEDLRTMLTARNEGSKAFTAPSEYLEVVLTVA